ncbi:MAG: DUF1887 family protein [Anaerolineales bacterium]|nr:DUF1887 family protein [Anaerolineales bacterium]
MTNTSPIPPDKQVNHLILLIGGNPLPNAVAGRLLVRGSGRITLVCSNDTEHVANDLKTWFANYQIINVTPKNVIESNAENIYTAVHNLIDRNEYTGLHYTGGTKAMAVHAHRAFRDILGKQAPKMSSYLDSRKLRLIFDDGFYYDAIGNLPTPFELQDFIDLHASLRTNPCTPPLTPAWLPETALTLAESWQNTLPDTWKQWYDEHIRPLERRPSLKHDLNDPATGMLIGWRYQNWQDGERLKATTVPFPAGKIGRKLKQELITAGYPRDLSDLNLVQAYNALATPPDIRPDCPANLEIEEVCAWLKAKWLEHYVASCLEKTGLFDSVYIGVETILEEDKGYPVCFELDVVGIRGYQLFVMSCTTKWKKPDVKQKLFEVTTRARQLGGDEAHIALVCTNNKPSHIQSESRATIDKHIRVFGSRDLRNLQSALTAWVEGRDS